MLAEFKPILATTLRMLTFRASHEELFNLNQTQQHPLRWHQTRIQANASALVEFASNESYTPANAFFPPGIFSFMYKRSTRQKYHPQVNHLFLLFPIETVPMEYFCIPTDPLLLLFRNVKSGFFLPYSQCSFRILHRG